MGGPDRPAASAGKVGPARPYFNGFAGPVQPQMQNLGECDHRENTCDHNLAMPGESAGPATSRRSESRKRGQQQRQSRQIAGTAVERLGEGGGQDRLQITGFTDPQ